MRRSLGWLFAGVLLFWIMALLRYRHGVRPRRGQSIFQNDVVQAFRPAVLAELKVRTTSRQG
jgi:hypothetical protein